MKASDLRLGNRIIHASYEMYVVGIWDNTIHLNFEGNEGDIWEANDVEIKPIPLTEERLLSLGYKKAMNRYYHPITMNYELANLTALDHGFKIMAGRFNGKEKFFYAVSEQLKFVHEIQNFHFASTGTELTLTATTK